MKKRLQGVIAGVLIGVSAISGVYAVNTTTLYDVISSGVKIVVDGHRLNPTDVNGNKVEPMIYNGTTYLPVRAVANALGKAVYWDGPNYTVYLGEMSGQLEYPTEELSIDDNIGAGWRKASDLKDNLGNTYSRAIYAYNNHAYEKICNMKYSRFKGTIYVKDGSNDKDSTQIIIKADDKTIYTSSEITKVSPPIYFDVDITGCYDLQIINTAGEAFVLIGDAGFYQ